MSYPDDKEISKKAYLPYNRRADSYIFISLMINISIVISRMISLSSFLTFLSKILTLKMGCATSRPELSIEDLDFIANHTAMTRDKIDQHYESFLSIHPDGKITRKGFATMMRARYPGRDTTQLESHIFRMYDSNGDGYIDFREFIILLYVMSNGTLEENLKKIFRVFDINNDGTVSQRELNRVVKDLFRSFENNDELLDEENVAEDAFKEMDINIDGKITQEEFIRACLGHETLSTMLALKVIHVFL